MPARFQRDQSESRLNNFTQNDACHSARSGWSGDHFEPFAVNGCLRLLKVSDLDAVDVPVPEALQFLLSIRYPMENTSRQMGNEEVENSPESCSILTRSPFGRFLFKSLKWLPSPHKPFRRNNRQIDLGLIES
ncbi:hypothetical protein A6X21_01550 [Planctopirus hydrillae]|uniref:Uncharacterized protein n=1 Tax=Planctopirus hydrillae TaxID=1841610 RepID=A0A1C3EU51_9PLAN|nr:hypothetical protein A6X21_01550 [Planctopirus hydrillae]